MKRLAGMYAALISGFEADGSFSAIRQRNILDHVGQQGLTGLYIGGSSGESALMSTDELSEQQRVVAAARRPQFGKIIAHVGVPSTRDSVTLARQAEKLGFDALSALPPHAYPFSDEEIYEYYRELTSVTSLPFIVYEIPLRTHRAIPLELIIRLADLPNVTGIKFTSSDLYKLSTIRKSRPELTCFFGFDEMFLGAGALGCDGGIGTTYNVLGKLYVALRTSLEAHNLEEARRLQAISQDYVDILMTTGVLPGVKATLEILGHDVGPTRKPFFLKEVAAIDEIRRFLERSDVCEWLL